MSEEGSTSEGAIARSIVGFVQDQEAHWVAVLDCGHTQHVRHQPPFVMRPWTQTKEGREGMLGHTLRCLRCEAAEWPEGLVHYKSTRSFSQHSIPKGLLADHATKRGVWGRIVVYEGALWYHVGETTQRLTPSLDGIVVPEQLHYVAPDGFVRFQVDFYRKEEKA